MLLVDNGQNKNKLEGIRARRIKLEFLNIRKQIVTHFNEIGSIETIRKKQWAVKRQLAPGKSRK